MTGGPERDRAPLRVVHVLHSFHTGGMEKGIATVISHASPDIEHVVVCLTTSGATAARLPQGTPVVEMNKPPGNSLRFLWRLSRRLADLGPTVVHTRNWGGLDGVVAARFAGLRAVVHGEHGWDVGDPAGENRKRIFGRRLCAGWIREFTCVSHDIGRWLTDRVRIKRPVTQIYNGVDTGVFAPCGDRAETLAELGVPAGTFVVGIVGRLDPIKDHPTLFQAFKRLQEVRPDAVLLVVGDGPERARLEVMKSERVRLLGNRADVPQLIRAMDLFALVSRNEGISNTILEAMSSEVPCVVTAVGGNPELVEEDLCGSLVPPGGVSELAEAMISYAVDPSKGRRQGAAGRRRILDRFSIASMVRGYESVWRRVSANRP